LVRRMVRAQWCGVSVRPRKCNVGQTIEKRW
jgi:hypothetical protein